MRVILDRRREIRFEQEPPRTAEQLRRVDEELAAESPEHVDIAVLGEPRRFELWRHPGGWVAGAVDDGHLITVRGRGVEPGQVRLVRVYDLEPYLAGRRAFLERGYEG